ncbi:MAG: DNA polymerase III subunit delta [Candidatus Azambacteria bacterium]|nr:DNA polymerase III subunit delta [Candidatus Azambacteria bacterium]
MIIVLHGLNTFFTKRKRDEIVAGYRAKHPQGLSFFEFDEESDTRTVKEAIETISLFEDKKLVVCRNFLRNVEDDEVFFSWLKERKIKEDNTTVVVLSENRVLVGKKENTIAWLLERPTVAQQADSVSATRLPAWLIQEAARHQAEIERDAALYLIDACGDDLWRLSQEIEKCATYNKKITKEHTQLLVPMPAEGRIFDALSALEEGNTKKAAVHFSALLKEGEDWAKMFGAVVFHFRSMVRVRSLLDLGWKKEQIQKELGMHPFALQKAITHASTKSMDSLSKTYHALARADHSLKTGAMMPEAFFERLLLGI